jgi:hypothetical protein
MSDTEWVLRIPEFRRVTNPAEAPLGFTSFLGYYAAVVHASRPTWLAAALSRQPQACKTLRHARAHVTKRLQIGPQY